MLFYFAIFPLFILFLHKFDISKNVYEFQVKMTFTAKSESVFSQDHNHNRLTTLKYTNRDNLNTSWGRIIELSKREKKMMLSLFYTTSSLYKLKR